MPIKSFLSQWVWKEVAHNILMINLHILDQCFRYLDVFFCHPLWISGIEICTKALWILGHIMISSEVQRRRILHQPSHEGRWRWFLLLENSNLGAALRQRRLGLRPGFGGQGKRLLPSFWNDEAWRKFGVAKWRMDERWRKVKVERKQMGWRKRERLMSLPLVRLALVGGRNSWNSPLFGVDLKTLWNVLGENNPIQSSFTLPSF